MEKDMIKRDDEKKLKFNFEEFKDQIEDLFLACEGQAEIAGLEAAMQECIEQVVDSIIQGEYGGNDDEYLNGGFSFSYPDEEGFITLEEVGYDEYDLTIDLGIKIEDEYEEDGEEDDEEDDDNDIDVVWTDVIKSRINPMFKIHSVYENKIINAEYSD